jgi:DNA helicase-2/ATP-dependent DNA helicase PcrA
MIRIEVCADEPKEGEFVASTIATLVNEGHRDIEGQVGLEKVAVLGRTKFALFAVEAALIERGLSFYKKVSAATYESESDVVEEFELALRVLSNPLDRLHLGRLVAKWNAGVSVEDVYGESDLRAVSGLEVLEQLSRGAKGGFCNMTMNAIHAVRWTPEDFKFLRGVESLEREAGSLEEEERALVLGDLKEWRKHWDYFVRSGPGGKHSVPSFLNQVALGTTQQPRQDGVALLTVHSAKGTEFDVVFVVGMSEGTFPDFRAKGEAMREEQRNAFVAVTRSRRLLYLSYPRMKRMPWGDLRAQAPSRFLGELRDVAAQHGGGS